MYTVFNLVWIRLASFPPILGLATASICSDHARTEILSQFRLVKKFFTFSISIIANIQQPRSIMAVLYNPKSLATLTL